MNSRVTYRRRINPDADSHETLTIWINGALVGRLTVRANEERQLIDVIVSALEANGATVGL